MNTTTMKEQYEEYMAAHEERVKNVDIEIRTSDDLDITVEMLHKHSRG